MPGLLVLAPQRAEELLEVAGQQGRFFHCREMAAFGELGPVGDLLLRVEQRADQVAALNTATPRGVALGGAQPMALNASHRALAEAEPPLPYQ